MKKIIFLMLLLFGISAAYSQVTLSVKEYDELKTEKTNLANKIDSLQRTLKHANDSLQKGWKHANDSITKLISENKIEIKRLTDRVGKLEKDLAKEKDKVADLNKSTVKIQNDTLQNQNNRLNAQIADLKQIIADKDKQIAEIRKNGDIKANEKYQAGRNDALSSLINSYKNKSFDDLIKSSTKESVHRDFLLINHTEVGQTLIDLQTYFSAKELLSKKFDDSQIKNAQPQLDSLKQQSELLKNLKETIRDYKLCNDALKTTIEKIQKIDKVPANDDKTQEIKLKDILFELAWYFRNYRFNFTDYPYHSYIVLEIMNRKQKDANADISDLLEKL
jgi:hypothetical protein